MPIYGCLGRDYFSLGDFERAIEYHKEDMTKEVGDRAGQGRACGNLGHAYSALDDFQQAKDYYEHCLSIAKEVGDRVGEGHAYYCLGTSLLAEGCLNEALFHFKSSVETIVPDGALSLAPWAALSESLRIRTVPSLTCFKLIIDSPDDYHCKSGALLVGDPCLKKVTDKWNNPIYNELPFAKKEVEMIGEILNAQPLTGEVETKKQLLYCHRGEDVVSSEGVVGMARAFLFAGARSVLATLWAIDDEATQVFMKRFYQHLRNRESASTALQKAMKSLRDSDKFSAPKCWAPFVLIGDDVTIDFA
ncbi:unnamed protein product [Porites evermanni]|uniref:CHAT domain-containing protein n=1 Tax=Porites evermanni TaxID=104178 RepID=A0ABN8T3V7_9CNID|nr:unnamed protein product [Porites evermanni]